MISIGTSVILHSSCSHMYSVGRWSQIDLINICPLNRKNKCNGRQDFSEMRTGKPTSIWTITGTLVDLTVYPRDMRYIVIVSRCDIFCPSHYADDFFGSVRPRPWFGPCFKLNLQKIQLCPKKKKNNNNNNNLLGLRFTGAKNGNLL